MCLFEIQTKTNLAAQSLVKREEKYKSKLYFLNFKYPFSHAIKFYGLSYTGSNLKKKTVPFVVGRM